MPALLPRERKCDCALQLLRQIDPSQNNSSNQKPALIETGLTRQANKGTSNDGQRKAQGRR